MITKKQNVGMIFDEESHPIAIYWKNGMGMKIFLLKEVGETDMDMLMKADGVGKGYKLPGQNETEEALAKLTILQ